MAGSVGGVISGMNPFHYNSGSPITLFLFQTCLILLTCNLVNIPFSKIRQPKVISEVISGVILGPTVLGQIPNYSNTVFPKESVPGLSLASNLGIILFMFFLGLEVDIPFIKKHIKTALSIGLASLAVPFGFGCLFSIPLYNTYVKGVDAVNVEFSVFMVFIAVSLSVTAFPVLCRILTELRLIRDRVGVVVLASGITNDVIGWALLALSVILSNSQSSPVNTVYILLCTVGWFFMFVYPVKHILRWLLIRFNELERSKPSPVATMFILVLMFISAYFTDIIGVHPIFGAFIAGLVVPRDNNYVVKLTERMEDIPNIVLIPIYFAVAGLNVDLTLLNEGKDWGYTIASIAIAVSTKIVAGALMSKLNGLFWRESFAVGILMSCKGIVEIVVLTTGLNAGIISKKIYAMFILMALVSTFITTPLTIWEYPDSYREKVSRYLNEEKPWDDTPVDSNASISIEDDFEDDTLSSIEDIKCFQITQLVNILDNTDSISSSLSLLNYMVYGSVTENTESPSHSKIRNSGMRVKARSKLGRISSAWTNDDSHTLKASDLETSAFEYVIPLKAVHLQPLTQRTADLIQSSTLHNEDHLHVDSANDSLLKIFNIFCDLNHVPFSSEIIFSTMREKAMNIASIRTANSDLMLVPVKGAVDEVTTTSSNSCLRWFSNFNEAFSHLLGANELPTNFFDSLASSIKVNSAVLVYNSRNKLERNKLRRRHFYLLLPNPNLSSSDYLALHLMLLTCHNTSKKNLATVDFTVFVNHKNVEFHQKFYESFGNESWFINSRISVINIDLKQTFAKSEDEISQTSFIENVLEKGLSSDQLEDLDESLFFVAEQSFSEGEVFGNEVKSVILNAFNKRFNVLICHHYTAKKPVRKTFDS